MPKKYSPELRERAVRLVLERQAVEGGPRSRSIRAIAPQVGVAEETLRLWCNRYGPEAEPTPVAESLEEQNKRLKRELAEARRANEILKAASAFFARELDRPTTTQTPAGGGVGPGGQCRTGRVFEFPGDR